MDVLACVGMSMTRIRFRENGRSPEYIGSPMRRGIARRSRAAPTCNAISRSTRAPLCAP